MALYTTLPSVFDDLFALVDAAERDLSRIPTIRSQTKDLYQDLPSFPASDVAVDQETGDLHIAVALPGYDEEDIEVSFENDTVQIDVCKDNAMQKRKKETRDSRMYLRDSLKTSKVRLKAPVPFNKFKIKAAEASYNQGILDIKIPRSEDHAPHKLQLTVKTKPALED